MNTILKVLHLSQTDIHSDSRILKEINAIKNHTDLDVSAIGVESGSVNNSMNLDNVEIISIKLFSRKFNFLPKTIKNVFVVFEISIKMFRKSFAMRPKIIHCHDTPVLPLGYFLKKILGCKLIYDAHELESNRNGLSKIAGKMTFFVEKWLWSSIDRLIVVSPSIKSWYNDKIGLKNTEIILNSPEIIDSKPIKNTYLKKKFNIPEHSKIFLYVGIFAKGRGIRTIVDAFKRNNLKSHLVFLGYGDLEPYILDVANKFSNIHIHSAVQHDKVVEIAMGADVGLALIENISLSDYFSLPNKLFEYAFSGIPVLASNFPDISDLVKKYNLGQCTDLKPDSIYNAIKLFEDSMIFENKDLGNLFELSWESQAEKLISVYQELLNEIRRLN